MVKVYVEYGVVIKETGDESFHYKYFEVSGHADNINGTAGIKCCAGISACIIGLDRVLIGSGDYSYKIDKGEFYLKQQTELASNKEINYYMNLLLCQLYEIYQLYPNAFSSFETKRLFTKKGKKTEWHK